jgi:membrane protein YdbS with pleckstrin-like domain
MYCYNCGNELGTEVPYCTSCGVQQLDAPEGGSARDARVVIKPFFTPLNIFVSVIPLQLFFTLWGAAVFGIAGFFVIQYFELGVDPWTVALVFGCLFFVFTPVIAMYMLTQRYARAEYRFFADRLDYREGFYSTEEKSIGYKHIIEVNLVRSFWKRLFNLGTIVLSTAANGNTTGPSRSGIRIPDVQAPHATYNSVKRVIENCKSSLEKGG